MARARTPARAAAGSAADYLPPKLTLPAMRAAADGCRGCELYARATQVVFGEGKGKARLVVVGEQPGDKEDLAGRPFVGPAGALLDEALVRAGIRRDQVYLTNAVKHFKFELRGKRRIHSKPSLRQVTACRPWLEAELAVVEPRTLLLLGATAAQALLGSKFRVTEHRGEALETPWAPVTFATIHPSSLLRVTDETERRAAREAWFREIEAIAATL